MPSKEYVHSQTIVMNNCKPGAWLCEKLRDSDNCILILDCRPNADFKAAHVRGAVNVTLPSLMLRRLAHGTLSLSAAIKCNEEKDKFNKNWKTHTIVLCDERGEGETTVNSGGDVTTTLLRRLQQDGCSVVFLEGGFTNFQSCHPEWCRMEAPSESPVLGLQNLHISCSDSESDDDPFQCEYSLGRETPFEEQGGSFPVEILPLLFLGNARNSADQAALEKHRIKYILNVTPDLPNTFEEDPNIKYMKIPITDHGSQNLALFFPEAIAFIDEARCQQVGVLVHCLAGISRSVTITVAYLMHSQNMTLNDAYDFVKKRKANISPNFNFMGQLHEFERQLRPTSPCSNGGPCSLTIDVSTHSIPGSTDASPRHLCPSCSSTSSSALSSPDSAIPSPYCHCHRLGLEQQLHRGVIDRFTRSCKSDMHLHASPDSGIEFESWT